MSAESEQVVITLSRNAAIQIALLLHASDWEVNDEINDALGRLSAALPKDVKEAQYELWLRDNQPNFRIINKDN